jgi:Tfp pilus assembly protein PilV
VTTMQSLLVAVRVRAHRQRWCRSVIGPSRTRRWTSSGPAAPAGSVGSEEGFLLIEVIISAFLVALIVIGTFNGFDAVSRSTADQRRHSEAALLAAQSEEQLRTDPATALDALESAPHAYTKEVFGTTYTITQEAKPVNAKGTSTGCKGTESSKENGANIQISSSVTWALLLAAKRPAVKQVSIITPPVGSSLEVDVTNGATTPVAGVTAVAKFLPTGSSSYDTVEGTTGSAGCVVFTGLESTLATVEIDEKTNFVTTSGKLKYPTKEVSIAPNITTSDPVTYDEGGRVTAKFTYKGATEWEGKPVKSDTFVVANTSIPAGYAKFELGSTAFEYQTTGEQPYKALTGTYASTATTATATKYSNGDLFPFGQAWTVYAGDCPADKVSSEAEVSGGATVTAGGNTEVKVPLSRTEASIWTGANSSSKGAADKEHLGPVKITNTSCESAETPDNASGRAFVHEQSQTTTEGHLEDPFQPFGSYTLCLVDKSLKKTYTVSETNSTATGTTPQIYLGQRTETEDAENKAKETEAKTKRETAETEAKAAKTKREKEETEAKTKETKAEKEKAQETSRKSDETTEAAERKTWEEEEKHQKFPYITAAERTTKVTAQTTARTKRETTEGTERTKWATEEAEAKTAKEKREKEETEAKAPREKREKEETEAKTAKEAREKEEATEKASKVTVASGETC